MKLVVAAVLVSASTAAASAVDISLRAGSSVLYNTGCVTSDGRSACITPGLEEQPVDVTERALWRLDRTSPGGPLPTAAVDSLSVSGSVLSAELYAREPVSGTTNEVEAGNEFYLRGTCSAAGTAVIQADMSFKTSDQPSADSHEIFVHVSCPSAMSFDGYDGGSSDDDGGDDEPCKQVEGECLGGLSQSCQDDIAVGNVSCECVAPYFDCMRQNANDECAAWIAMEGDNWANGCKAAIDDACPDECTDFVDWAIDNAPKEACSEEDYANNVACALAERGKDGCDIGENGQVGGETTCECVETIIDYDVSETCYTQESWQSGCEIGIPSDCTDLCVKFQPTDGSASSGLAAAAAFAAVAAALFL